MIDERTLRMMDNYVTDFKSGMDPKEIGAKYGLSSWTVYHYLPEIARREGVPKDSLLKRPHDVHIMTGVRNYEPVKPIDVEETEGYLGTLKQGFQDVLSMMDKAETNVDKVLLQHEREASEYGV